MQRSRSGDRSCSRPQARWKRPRISDNLRNTSDLGSADMTIEQLGALGDFVGAIGVIATLAYLAVQVRQNTHSLEASQRLAASQTYQLRADALQSMVVDAAASPLGAIIVKLTESGYP